MENLLKNLAFFISEYWYRMIALASFVLLVIALVVPIQAMPNIALVIMAFGGFLIGIGEWINHPYHVTIYPDGLTMKGHGRVNSLGGVIIVFIGVCLFIAGVVVAVRA